MILIGRNASPFVRRVAISLHLLDLPFEQKEISTIHQRDEILKYNPLGRVPALVLDDGEVLIDSTPILDHLDQSVGSERALVPSGGAARRQVLKLVAFAMGAMEKAVLCFFERNIRPVDKRHQELLDKFADQALAGLAQLEGRAGEGWLFGSQPTQADISAVAALGFLQFSWAERIPPGLFPKLEALSDRAHALSAFADTKPKP